MGRTVQFSWPQLETSLHVELLDDVNPLLADEVWQAAPLFSIQSHAVVAGKQIYFPTRLTLLTPDQAGTELMSEQPLGRVNFEPYFQYIALNYGPMSEPVPAWPIGQVVSMDIEKLPALGRSVWEHFLSAETDLLVTVDRVDAESAPVDLDRLNTRHRAAALSKSLTWQDVLARIEDETAAIWMNEPEDVQALRLGVQTSDAGVYGQYFSPWVMVTGLIRSLAVVDLSALNRLAYSPHFGLPQLQTLLHEMLSVPLGVVGYFGLPQLGAVLNVADSTVDQIDRLADFQRFVAVLLTYVNRYNLWLHQTFPWRLGALFPKPDMNDAQAFLELSSLASYKET